MKNNETSNFMKGYIKFKDKKIKNVIATLHHKNLENFCKLDNQENWVLIDSKEGLNKKALDEIKPNYIFIPVWHWRIPEEIWSNYKCVVFHMTDLPFGRGASPYENLMLRGIYNTKVSALKVEHEFDAGDIYMKSDFKLSESKEDTLNRVSNLIFYEMMPYILKNNPTPVKQVGTPTYFKKISQEEFIKIRKANSLIAALLDG